MIPCETERATSAGQQEGMPEAVTGRESQDGALVLVVDDDGMVRDAICEVLTRAGCRVLGVADGAAALDLARHHRPAVIILDIMMPRMDGFTAMTHLLGSSPDCPPVVILTAQSNPAYRQLSEGMGAAAHITKPFAPAELVDAVRRVAAPRAAAPAIE